MPNAARKGDPIGHSPAMSWLIQGLAIGAAVGLAAIAIAGTGGLAAVAIVGGLAAGGAGVGELLSSMSWAPKEESGNIATGASNVLFNNIPAACAHVDNVLCSKHSNPNPVIANGSSTVIINNMPAARVDDKLSCSAVITNGSPNIIIGGPPVQTDDMHPEDLVPSWVHWSLLAVGGASAITLGGPVIGILGLAGGFGGGYGGQWVGGEIFGEGSDGQKWSMLGGSIIGGGIGTKGGMLAANKAIPVVKTPLSGFTKEGVFGYRRGLAYDFYKGQGMPEPRISGHLQGIDFNKPVSVETLPVRTRVTQFQSSGSPQGDYYSEPGFTPEQLGISPETQTPSGKILPRTMSEYDTNRPVNVLKSTAKEINDTWSIPGKSISTKGGGTQYYTSDKGGFTPYP